MKHSVCGLMMLVALSGVAHAQMICLEREKLVKVLNEQYREFAIGVAISGKSDSTNVIEVYVSKKGTWTAMKTNGDGLACLVDSGENWQTLIPEIEGKKT